WIPGDPIRIDPGPIIRGVVDDLASGSPPSRISGKFHRSLVRMFTELCRKIRRDADLNRVALSGGVFQNAILLTGLIRSLERERFQVFTHRRVPANDGGVSLGQAAAAARIARG
ncbi:MAG: carbamoyltransferase HypF, partial [Desulfobacterales bacterium]|nr:carbamoyltransferase HypF [Desulfobacterales bacterium]